MPTSPDIRNYHYGAGAVYFKADGIDMDYRHLGNIPELNYASEVTEVDHNQSMSGIKSVDLSYITAFAATLSAILEEVTGENLALFAMGTVTESTDGKEIMGLSQTSIRGDLKYVSDQPMGPTIEFYARAQAKPNGDFALISDGLATLPIQFKILRYEDSGAFGRWVVIEDEA